MKYARIVLAVALILLALWVIVGEQMTGASANAVVNAPVVTVRSQVAGKLELPDRSFGSHISTGDQLASVTDGLVDRTHLDDLVMEQSIAKAETQRLTQDLKDTRDVQQGLKDRSDIFHSERLTEIRTRLDHARVRLAILEGGKFPSDLDKRLIDGLGVKQTKLPNEPKISALVLDHAREEVSVLQTTLEAAEKGVFLGDGYNDSPNAEQRATELDTVIGQLQTSLTASKAKEAALAQRLDQERLRVNALTGGDIASPVNGLYWEILQANGVTVQRGDPILRLVDCDRLMVTLSVTERIYNHLGIGQKATFRLQGQKKVYNATVARLAGSGAATIYENLAVAPGKKQLERYDVTLQVPDLAKNAGCVIGQTGRAFFDARPLDWLRR